MKRDILILSALCTCCNLFAEEITVKYLRYAGPYEIKGPFIVDSLDVNSKKFTDAELLKTAIPFNNVRKSNRTLDAATTAGQSKNSSVSLASFYLNSDRYTDGTLQISGPEHYEVYIDNEKQTPANGELKLTLEPRRYEVVIKYLTAPDETNHIPKVTFKTDSKAVVTATTDPEKRYTLSDVFDGTRIRSVSLSPNGKYLLTAYQTTYPGGDTESFQQVTDRATGQVLMESNNHHYSWMPRSNRLYYTRKGMQGKELVTIDPATQAEEVLAHNLPDGWFSFAPTEDFLLFNIIEEGPKKGEDLQEILVPDDRQPGWRNRSYLAKYDLKTGLLQPLTFGYHNVWAADISNDGRYLLMMTSQSRLTKRPTTLFSLYRLDMQTLQAELLIDKDGFISGARFSPDGTQVLVSGSPESLGGIGKNVKEGQTPSMTDGQLYLLNIADKRVTPLTKDFNPSVQRAVWNKADGQIYFTAENRDCYSLYRMNPADGKIQQLEVSEDLVNSFSLAQNAPVMVYYGQSASNSDRLYTMNTKKMKSSLLEDLSKDILKDVELGECKAWSFTNSRGDTIYGRYYLPPHFDANRKYPMIVNYYGGCSPVSRNFESRYPHHAYAALGYVVYVIEPSGATGFGQEFSARHVNTAGEGVAQDIIEGTKQFCKEHAFVNDKKIGCIGASYGGFMTQYLQTQTDIFAAAISHAGISDHTSYWGEGYWGYSYSEVSMANSYPWSNPDLFVKQSPLFNADKIHTPLLFLHGDADVNVPVGESIQMFTALKLLGRETAFVAVTGQDHHIVDYGKRIQWQNTIFAWFAKWLQDDATWWNAIYKPKAL